MIHLTIFSDLALQEYNLHRNSREAGSENVSVVVVRTKTVLYNGYWWASCTCNVGLLTHGRAMGWVMKRSESDYAKQANCSNTATVNEDPNVPPSLLLLIKKNPKNIHWQSPIQNIWH